jgi:KRAB domain-containing zinc finger protein
VIIQLQTFEVKTSTEMAQPKISNYFALKPKPSASDDKSNEIVSNIKQEPEVEFIALLPQFQPDKTLLGNFKVKTEKDENTKVKYKKDLVPQYKNYRMKQQEADQTKENLKDHEESETFECDICLKVLKDRIKLKEHILTIHKGEAYPCRHCLETHRFHRKNVARIMRRECSSKMKPELTCNETFSTILFILLAERCICDICGKRFRESHAIRQHVKTHLKPEHRLKRIKNCECDFCSKRFYNKEYLRLHMMRRHIIKEKLFKCNQCPYSGKNKYYLAQHMAVHNKPFKCTKCDQVFSQKRNLDYHLKRHELPEVKEFVCYCSKTFKSSGALKSHKIFMHKEKPTGERTFKCKTCDYAATTSVVLQRHEATHLKQFKCHNCNKSFSLNKDLKYHLSYEPTSQWSCFRNKTFSCKFCEKVCVNRSLLAKHSLSHADRVQCSICQKVCSASSIKSHIKSHKIKAQEPKFQCELCPKTFHLIVNLRNHDRRVHNKNLFTCDFCGHKLNSKLKLSAHLKYQFSKSNWKCQTCCVSFAHKSSLKTHCEQFHNKSHR